MRKARVVTGGVLAVAAIVIPSSSALAARPLDPGCQGRIVAEFNHNSGEAGASGNPNASAGPGYFLGPNTAAAVHGVMQDFCG